MKVLDAKRDNLTYGEAVQVELDSVQLIKGKWEQTIKVINKPPRMSREQASKHYNKKLFLYFKTQMKQASKHVDKKLSFLMFNDPHKYRELL